MMVVMVVMMMMMMMMMLMVMVMDLSKILESLGVPLIGELYKSHQNVLLRGS